MNGMADYDNALDRMCQVYVVAMDMDISEEASEMRMEQTGPRGEKQNRQTDTKIFVDGCWH